MRRLLFPALAIVFLALSCQKSENRTADTPEPIFHVKAAPAVYMDMIDTVHIYGEVKLRQEALLASQFNGRLTDFSLLIGDRVKKNQQIGVIIPPQREALLQVLNQIDTSMRPLLEQQIKAIPLISPLDGVVLAVRHHSGDVVQKGEPIVHIGDLRRLDVYGDLPLPYLPLVRKLKHITVSFVDYPHQPISLPIEALGGKVDEATQTVPLRLSLTNEKGEFRPGMLVRLIFPGEMHHSAIAIPRSALLEEEGIYRIYVLSGNKAEERQITVGIRQNDFVEVLSVLHVGEQVITQKAYSLTDGVEVIAN